MDLKLENKVWWGYIEDDLQELLAQSEFLTNTITSWGGDLRGGSKVFSDYSFLVFPAAKAYEGFLKKVFFDLGFINSTDYRGKRFRIGKALNPFLEQDIRAKESVYDKLVNYCGSLPTHTGKELADKLWRAWIEGRNLVFHWFPDEKKVIDFDEAQEKIQLIIEAIDSVFKECKIDKDHAKF